MSEESKVKVIVHRIYSAKLIVVLIFAFFQIIATLGYGVFGTKPNISSCYEVGVKTQSKALRSSLSSANPGMTVFTQTVSNCPSPGTRVLFSKIKSLPQDFVGFDMETEVQLVASSWYNQICLDAVVRKIGII